MWESERESGSSEETQEIAHNDQSNGSSFDHTNSWSDCDGIQMRKTYVQVRAFVEDRAFRSTLLRFLLAASLLFGVSNLCLIIRAQVHRICIGASLRRNIDI